jgi:hypothetical protein
MRTDNATIAVLVAAAAGMLIFASVLKQEAKAKASPTPTPTPPSGGGGKAFTPSFDVNNLPTSRNL